MAHTNVKRDKFPEKQTGITKFFLNCNLLRLNEYQIHIKKCYKIELDLLYIPFIQLKLNIKKCILAEAGHRGPVV